MTFISDDTKKIIEKIKKLFSLSQSSNEHEAALALSRAYELLEKYNLNEESINITEYEEQHLDVESELKAHSFVIRIIELLIPVEIVNERYGKKLERILIFGKSHNVEVAKFLYIYLVRQYQDLWLKNRKAIQLQHMMMFGHQGSKLKNAYYIGLSVTIKKRIAQEITGNEQGIIPLKKDPNIIEFIKSKHSIRIGKQAPQNNVSTVAYQAGKADGDKVALNKVFNSSSSIKPAQISQ